MSISKNIKTLRTDSGLSQEDLAEKLHVTRQTVSSWETERTQPDIDTLTALAAALDADIMQLLYGKAAAYKQNQKKYLVTAIICGVLVAACLGLMLFFMPYVYQAKSRIEMWALYFGIVFYMGFVPLAFTCFSAGALSATAIRRDIRLKSINVRVALIIASILILLVVYLPLAAYLGVRFSGVLLKISGYMIRMYSMSQSATYFAAMLAGAGLFLGFNK